MNLLRVTYRLTSGEPEALAEALCVEQTIEFPRDLVTDRFVLDHVVARVEGLEAAGPGQALARLAFEPHVVGSELTQLLNVVYGNASLLPGVRVEAVDLPGALLAAFRGPRHGVAGLRALLGAPRRPLLCSALKPLGLPPDELADLAYRYALGGLDLVKDDHGLADQPFGRFQARVAACAAAIERANRAEGGRCLYVPNVTAPADQLVARARFARDAGAGALMVAPGLVGFDALRALGDDDALGLPLFLHPAFLGSFVTRPTDGLAHGVLFGTLARLAGADVSIFPHAGGRFSFAPADCAAIAAACAAPLGGLAPILPAPAGGMRLDRATELRAFYGADVVFLIGGDLHRHGDLVATCRRFRASVERDVEVASFA